MPNQTVASLSGFTVLRASIVKVYCWPGVIVVGIVTAGPPQAPCTLPDLLPSLIKDPSVQATGKDITFTAQFWALPPLETVTFRLPELGYRVLKLAPLPEPGLPPGADQE